MQPLTRTTVVGVFHDRASADRALAELRRLGFADDRLGVVVRDEPPATATSESEWEIGATTGAVAGGATGTLLGIAVAAGLIPGVGPVIAGGLLGGLLASAATGAVAGSVLGALIGLGVPEEEAAYYSDEFAAGRTLVTVRADDRAAEVHGVLRRFGAYDIDDRNTERAGGLTGDPRAAKDISWERTDVGAERPADAARRPEGTVLPPATPPGL
jgi:hypothetical protein